MWCHAHIHDCSYLYALWDQIGLGDKVIMVLHDWGSALGFDGANGHREAVKGIAYMEAIVRPWDHWDQLGPGPHSVWQTLRSQAGEAMILRDNFFVERVLPKRVLRPLSDEEVAPYRRPFAEPGEGRRPTLTWPREVPIGGEPADVVAIVAAYADWLGKSNVPKLFLKAEPGSILAGRESRLRTRMANADRGESRGAPFRSGRFAGRHRKGHCRVDGKVGLTGTMQRHAWRSCLRDTARDTIKHVWA